MEKKDVINQRFTEMGITQAAAAKMLDTTPQQVIKSPAISERLAGNR